MSSENAKKAKKPYSPPGFLQEQTFERKVLMACGKIPGAGMCDPEQGGFGPAAS